MDTSQIEEHDKIFSKETFEKLGSSHFERCTFTHCQFLSTDCKKSVFIDCSFDHCMLSSLNLEGCRLQHVTFSHSKLIGLHFPSCEKKFLQIKFVQTLIHTCNFSDMELKGTSFKECTIKDTFFTGAKLKLADFFRSDLAGSTFHNTELTGASFIEAINYLIDPKTNTLTKARFSKPEVYTPIGLEN